MKKHEIEMMISDAEAAYEQWERLDSENDQLLEINPMALAAVYFRRTADFNMSWVDGRNGNTDKNTPEYNARRLDAAFFFTRLSVACIGCLELFGDQGVELDR